MPNPSCLFLLKNGWYAALFLLFLAASPAAGQDDQEQVKLLEQKKRLTARIETLRRDQDLLLFEKMSASTDSKYLVIRMKERTGQLKYKNKVLRDFALFPAWPASAGVVQGIVTVTRKSEDPKGRRSALIFGNSFALVARNTAARAAPGLPRIHLSKKDFNAVFFALEQDAHAYIIW
jgi:hypothetical protein